MSFDPREAIAAGVRAHHEGRSLPQTEAEIADRVMHELTARGYAVVKTQATKEALNNRTEDEDVALRLAVAAIAKATAAQSERPATERDATVSGQGDKP